MFSPEEQRLLVGFVIGSILGTLIYCCVPSYEYLYSFREWLYSKFKPSTLHDSIDAIHRSRVHGYYIRRFGYEMCISGEYLYDFGRKIKVVMPKERAERLMLIDRLYGHFLSFFEISTESAYELIIQSNKPVVSDDLIFKEIFLV